MEDLCRVIKVLKMVFMENLARGKEAFAIDRLLFKLLRLSFSCNAENIHILF